MKTVEFKIISHIRSEHTIQKKTPIQPVFSSQCKGKIELFPEYTDGLQDIEQFSHIILLYWLHRTQSPVLMVKPFLEDVEHGIFSTRAPRRPNPVGISIVRLEKRSESVLHISGVDILDGTPLIDIKPYVKRFDCIDEANSGWIESIEETTAEIRGKREYDDKTQ
ncbi:tRNA (N6-threonylcarbamoyladenosine(37)-N6)-methyltransferase TrmO [Chitinispirillales bacterium ANBcel5]|uniref:tRNA (N6-threonylcarbamoyladenosine(37)-N6)-methyltransferase TrmO n=1 Tax=Cellulosispirillum alkaliphilum TaxID=3039283 RepID=UPI002A4E54D9|nr:tRNA (N6-threonylcarbamoyladenosine(37)-N6)-methyltransferase TrmO [Chitinispirillales bacterium ANBcel5]